jgi:hypothetical protein
LCKFTCAEDDEPAFVMKNVDAIGVVGTVACVRQGLMVGSNRFRRHNLMLETVGKDRAGNPRSRLNGVALHRLPEGHGVTEEPRKAPGR